MGKFNVYTPADMEELKQCLIDAKTGTRIISGGTDIMIEIRKNPCRDITLIDISQVEKLDYIKQEDGFIKIGSRVTFTTISENQLIAKYGVCLSEAASQVGSTQIRNKGTIGGNIGNSSPAGDSLPALGALKAEVLLMDGEGHIEIIPIHNIIIGIGKNIIGYNRIITEIRFPVRPNNFISAFGKIGNRKTVSIARLNMAVAVEYDSCQDKILNANVVLGALGTKVMRCITLEEVLVGKKKKGVAAEDFINALTQMVDDAIPGRTTQRYKRQAIRGLGLDILDKLFKNRIFPEGG